MSPLARFFLYLMALLYIAAGINHFVHPDPYVKIILPTRPARLAPAQGRA
jgi:uncharacterized membrane protein